MARASAGFTLVELLAALAVLSVGLGVTALALSALRPRPGSEVIRALASARDSAVRTGQPVTWRRDTFAVRFLPDGSSSGGTVEFDSSAIVVDGLTGLAHATR